MGPKPPVGETLGTRSPGRGRDRPEPALGLAIQPVGEGDGLERDDRRGRGRSRGGTLPRARVGWAVRLERDRARCPGEELPLRAKWI
jgi:hypothetical protein